MVIENTAYPYLPSNISLQEILNWNLQRPHAPGRKDVQCTIEYHGSGTYEITGNVYVAGEHPVAVTDHTGGLNTLGTIKVKCGLPYPPHCRLDPSNNYQAVVSQRFSCYLYLFDEYYNECTEEHISLVSATVEGQCLCVHPAYSEMHSASLSQRSHSSCVSLSFIPRSKGVKELHVKVCGQAILTSMVQLNILPFTEAFELKFKKLKDYLKRNECVGCTPTITIDRNNILESAIHELHSQYFHHIIRVRFNDEPGIDTGGVARWV